MSGPEPETPKPARVASFEVKRVSEPETCSKPLPWRLMRRIPLVSYSRSEPVMRVLEIVAPLMNNKLRSLWFASPILSAAKVVAVTLVAVTFCKSVPPRTVKVDVTVEEPATKPPYKSRVEVA